MLGGARALLHLIGFDEPFGFSVVEAMACGTPVIAFRRGSMPELIETASPASSSTTSRRRSPRSARRPTLDRAGIRAQAVARFGRARMVDEYLDAYERLIA